MPAKSTGLAQPASGAAVLGQGAGSASPARSRLGLALVVIAAAQLMVVLDATIVNVALPHIQHALGFSNSGLEWVVNAYALTFGGFLLLGGRAGDILGRRRVFIAGLLVFSLASLLGGLATSEGWLLAARALQGLGGAIVAPTSLSLVATTFPEGPQRNRAFGVVSAMAISGAAIGLIAGGLLTTYASWRWVLFVNVPIGILVALVAPRVLSESERHTGKFDLPGAITGTGGLTALVYGLSNAATSQNGVSHWGDAKVIVSLVAAVVLLGAFFVIESRSKHALLPLRIFRNRNRSGANLILLCIGTAMFGLFFFLTIFVQTVWGYSALRSGIAYLPMVGAIMAMAGVSAGLVGRIGARPILIFGTILSAGGMFWLSRISADGSYAGSLLGPMLVTGVGLGSLFMPLFLVALSKVDEQDAGVASSLVNTGQQVGGSIGLALLGTIAWTVFANNLHSSVAAAKEVAARAAAAGHAVTPDPHQMAAIQKSMTDHALATGFSRGFAVSAGIMVLALIVALVMIRVTKRDLEGVNPQTMGG
jgi:EmrB/QacA subfamily drug resistance transporter